MLKREETLSKGPAVDLHHGRYPPSPPLSCPLCTNQQEADPVTIFLLVLGDSWLSSRAVLFLIILAQHSPSMGGMRTLLAWGNTGGQSEDGRCKISMH